MQQLVRSSYAPIIFLIMIIAGLAIFGFAIGVLMAGPSEVIGMHRLSELTCLQMAGSGSRATAVLSAFNVQELEALLQLLIPGDVVFAWGYGLTFSGVLGLLTLRMQDRWFEAGVWLMWAPLLASAFDVLEDLGLYQMTSQMLADGVVGSAAALTMLFAASKYVLLAVIGPVYGVLGVLQAIKTDRRARSIGLYVFVVLVAVSMVQKPLLEIPACF